MDDYDQSQKPPYSPASTGDNLSYQSISSKATVVGVPAIGRGFWSVEKQPPNQVLPTYTVQICVNGNPMNLDVYVARQPY